MKAISAVLLLLSAVCAAQDLTSEYSTLSASVKAQGKALTESHQAAVEAQKNAVPSPRIEIAATPAAARYSHRIDYVLPTFREAEDGTYALVLQIRTNRGSARYSQDHWGAIVFHLNEGKIVRDGDKLVYEKDGSRVPVAHTRWWYDPKWWLTGNARVDYKKTKIDSIVTEISGVTISIAP